MGPEGVSGTPWGVILKVLGVTFWGLWRSFWLLWGALGVLWGSLGVPGTFLGDSGAISGIFREIPGGLLAPFWDDFWYFFAHFVGFVFL